MIVDRKLSVLAGAKFYARASATRAIYGAIPQWDLDADEENWRKTRFRIQEEMIEMVTAILVAAEYPAREAAAAERAIEIIIGPAIRHPILARAGRTGGEPIR